MKNFKKYWQGLILIVIIVAVMIMSIRTPQQQNNYVINQAIVNDSIAMVNNFEKYKLNLDTGLNNLKNLLYNQKILDTLIKKNRADSFVYTLFATKNKNAETEYNELNNNTFKIKKELRLQKQFVRQPNIWLLILIILLSGVIGGFASTKYNLLEDHFVDNAKDQVAKVIASTNTFLMRNVDTSMSEEIEKYKKDIDILNKTLSDMQQQEGDKIKANIVFGIIASTLSFLALNTFGSKILDFQNDTDYFIFGGFGLIGAVFAKNWIKSIYEKTVKRSS